jgi:hypothetical protein
LLIVGLAGVAAALVLSVPRNGLFDLNLRRHQLTGMLLSHLSIAAIGMALYPRGEQLLTSVVRLPKAVLLCIAVLASAVLVGAWMTLFYGWPTYAAALARESGPLEPLQAGLYIVAAWLAGRAARDTMGTEPQRLYHVARAVCLWLALEEIEYFGLIEMSVGGRIEGVWVRSLHDLIAVGVRVPAVLAALVAVAVLAAAAVLWYIGVRSMVREASSAAAVPAMAACGVLALSQVLDHDNAALSPYAVALTYRLEEPCELIAALLLNVALIMKIREVARPPADALRRAARGRDGPPAVR